MFQIRLFGLAGAAISGWIIYSNWMKFNADGMYSMRSAVLLPLIAVLSFFIFLFPKYIGVPEKTAEKILVGAVFLAGVAAGVYNLYLMDPSKFGL